MMSKSDDAFVAGLSATPVDPRTIRWEDDHPVFRVTFYDLAPGTSPPPHVGINTDEWEVRGADIHAVMAWAESTAGTTRTWELHLLVHSVQAHEPGLIWLRGTNPNAGEWRPFLRAEYPEPLD